MNIVLKNDADNFCVTWIECDKSTAIRFHVPKYRGYLPFFISGNDVDKILEKQKVELTEYKLLKGILYAINEFEHEGKPWIDSSDRNVLLLLLDILDKGFSFESPEGMILDVASKVRDENGNDASRVILMNGLKFIPESSKIKSDLLCDHWRAACDERQTDSIDEHLHSVARILDQIDMNDILPSASEVVSYYGLASTVIAGIKVDPEAYLQKYAYKYIHNPSLKERIAYMLSNAGNVRLADMDVIQTT